MVKYSAHYIDPDDGLIDIAMNDAQPFLTLTSNKDDAFSRAQTVANKTGYTITIIEEGPGFWMKHEIRPERHTYWSLPTDQYNQPTGNVVPVMMTEREYNDARRRGWYFDNYAAAIARAMD